VRVEAGVTYGHMVRPISPRGHCHGNANNDKEHEDQRPPRVVGKEDELVVVISGAARGGYYGADKGDYPGKLHSVSTRTHRRRAGAVLTMAMEMVASAKGSPMMRPRLKVDRWP
jgi:hypothetical protein